MAILEVSEMNAESSTATRKGECRMRNVCECGKKALIPAVAGTRMRRGWISRKGHDVCQRCWRTLVNRFRRIKPIYTRAIEIYREAA